MPEGRFPRLFVWEMQANQGSGISFHFPFLSVGWEIKVWVIGPFFPPVRCLCIPLCVGWKDCSLREREEGPFEVCSKVGERELLAGERNIMGRVIP